MQTLARSLISSTRGRPNSSLTAPDQAVALNFAGFALRALGRLREAVEPIQANVAMNQRLENWKSTAVNSSNLSELLLTLGDVGPAVTAARESVTYADKSGDVGYRIIGRTTLADALHQAGDTRAAEALFAEAERLQKEVRPELPLYSLRGYQFCDMLLGEGRNAEVSERARASLAVVRNLLSIALDTLSLGRAAHQAWLLEGGSRTAAVGVPPNPIPSPRGGEKSAETARGHLDAAVEGLRKARSEDHMPGGLLARAAFRRDTGEWGKAQEDLAETYEIASRGGMRLFLADYHLESARLLLVQIPGVRPPDEWTSALARVAAEPAPSSEAAQSSLQTLTDADRARVREAREEWAKADALIQATGYHRRDGELAAMRELLDALER